MLFSCFLPSEIGNILLASETAQPEKAISMQAGSNQLVLTAHILRKKKECRIADYNGF
jgi:hypothetical protein